MASHVSRARRLWWRWRRFRPSGCADAWLPPPGSAVVSSTDFNSPFDPDIVAWTISIVEYDGSLLQLNDIDFQVTFDPLPANVGSGNAMRIAGTNVSADLFMYAMRRVTDLEPDTRYQVSWEIEIASNADRGCMGPVRRPARVYSSWRV